MEQKINIIDDLSRRRNQANRTKKFFAFRAPRENFTIADFEFDKMFGIGSYSKVSIQFQIHVWNW